MDIHDNLKNLDIKVYKSITSTNTVLKEMAASGAPEGTVLIAETQTEGRGRMGRNFYSPSDTGIYLSILLRPTIPAKDSLFLTTAAAVAVAKSIETIKDCNADIKWVNDIYIDNKKVCGILTEGSINTQNGGLDYAVVGIGINVCPPEEGFPSQLENIAGSIFTREEISTDKKRLLIEELLSLFIHYYKAMPDRIFFEEYKKRSFLLGKKIYVIRNDKHIPAKAMDIDDECHLIVKYDNGATESLSSGEVSIKLNQ